MVNLKRLLGYDQWLAKKSKQVTNSPVYLDVNGRWTKDRTLAAKMVKYPGPPRTEYEIRFKKSYYERNQNDPHKIKSVMAHELAHIKYQDHGPAFTKTAKKLGAGRYATARGKLKR